MWQLLVLLALKLIYLESLDLVANDSFSRDAEDEYVNDMLIVQDRWHQPSKEAPGVV